MSTRPTAPTETRAAARKTKAVALPAAPKKKKAASATLNGKRASAKAARKPAPPPGTAKPKAKPVRAAASRRAPRKAAGHAPTTAAPQVQAGPTTAAALSEDAAKNTLAISPIMGISLEDVRATLGVAARAALTQPSAVLAHFGAYAAKLTQVAMGTLQIELDPKDKRFADPGWKSSVLHARLVQAHALLDKTLAEYIGASSMSERDKARTQLLASIYVDTIAPSNTLMHPRAVQRALETNGQSLLKGFRNLIDDLRHNGGLPSSVDKSKFKLGGNIATSVGNVVFSNEVLELIQYAPATDKVYRRPLLITPPQVNKFYAMDLSPEKSLVRFATQQGIQVFAISWRNPTREHRKWDISSYVQALDQAVDAARDITGSPDISLWGACSGGMTAAAYVGWLAATGQLKVSSVVSPVCTLDASNAADSTMGLFVTPESTAAIKARVKRKGFVDGAELARVFAWLRPNDLIWNYWVNNYLLGNDPPAFDILYWNADTTRLPAAFHADLLDIFQHNPFTKAGKLQVLGEPLDMRKVEVDAYIVAGITDHITPWKACYPTARIYGEGSTFTLANAGHLQSILNPPGLAKSFFLTATAGQEDPQAWADGATRIEGSWWPHWMAWLHQRSREQVPAPKALGNARHPPGQAAPGTYIFEP